MLGWYLLVQFMAIVHVYGLIMISHSLARLVRFLSKYAKESSKRDNSFELFTVCQMTKCDTCTF